MRLWTVHPKYLDPVGLVALWREALLAQAVLRNRTLGYRRHPQLQRFRDSPSPRRAINSYLNSVYENAAARGYDFDRAKLSRIAAAPLILVTQGQLAYEWSWLLRKLRSRNFPVYRTHCSIAVPDAHPLFSIVPGPVSEWERINQRTGA